MNIIDESFVQKEKKKKANAKKIVLAFIIIITIAMVGIMIALLNIKAKRITVYVDGVVNTELFSKLRLERDDKGEITKILIPVKEIAHFVGYSAYNGDYQTKSEETNKCYVISESEVANLTLQSKRVYKLNLEDESTDYQYYDMEDKVEAYDGELYITPSGMEQVFNTNFVYNKSQRTIIVETLPYLVGVANTKVMEYGFDKLSESFANCKAIFDDLYIVTKGKEGQDARYGIVDATNGKVLVEAKYTDMEYLANVKDCIVADGAKFGVAAPKEKRIKIQVVYDDVELIDKDKGLYLICKNRKYGIVDLRGATKVPTELDEVGVDITKFPENNLKNKYLLADSLIPARQGDKWGLVGVDGNVVADAEFDSLGYIPSTNINAKPLLVIPGYDVIVVCKDKRYNVVNKSGNVVLPAYVDDIYMTYENGKYNYWMNVNGPQNILDFLNSIGITETNNEIDPRYLQDNVSQQNQSQSQEQEQPQEQSQEQTQEQSQPEEEQPQEESQGEGAEPAEAQQNQEQQQNEEQPVEEEQEN